MKCSIPNMTSISSTTNTPFEPPQGDSLAILDKIIRESDLLKDYELQDLLKQIHAMYPTIGSFERDFPSICFALATGVGKTRLMAAFITYLYTNYGIQHFFVLAPNLTIYNKLSRDFGDPSYSKYLFRGIEIFEQNPPRIVTGETYKEEVAGQQAISQSIEINIFNISKLNAETRGGKVPQIKRLSEYIGQSYFDYLANLPDLVLLMDESHHYRVDRGMAVINEIKASNRLDDEEVLLKAKAAYAFCEHVNTALPDVKKMGIYAAFRSRGQQKYHI